MTGVEAFISFTRGALMGGLLLLMVNAMQPWLARRKNDLLFGVVAGVVCGMLALFISNQIVDLLMKMFVS